MPLDGLESDQNVIVEGKWSCLIFVIAVLFFAHHLLCKHVLELLQ